MVFFQLPQEPGARAVHPWVLNVARRLPDYAAWWRLCRFNCEAATRDCRGCVSLIPVPDCHCDGVNSTAVLVVAFVFLLSPTLVGMLIFSGTRDHRSPMLLCFGIVFLILSIVFGVLAQGSCNTTGNEFSCFCKYWLLWPWYVFSNFR